MSASLLVNEVCREYACQMQVEGKAQRSIWTQGEGVYIIDQRALPHQFLTRELKNLDDACSAIADMWVRGAPLIGVTVAYGIFLALRERVSREALQEAKERLAQTRPTAVNLGWALERMEEALHKIDEATWTETAWALAGEIAEDDMRCSSKIGEYGLPLIEEKARAGKTVNILTHCNAGWLATVDWGTALAPIYKAHRAGIDLHVYVDETRPRNQGASLTAWELYSEGISHEVIVDNAGGHLMQHGLVDLCIVGSDRTTRRGDVCNKIGTYLKALAAKDNDIPFYVALPYSTIDWSMSDGLREIPIEERDGKEVRQIRGVDSQGVWREVLLCPKESRVRNFGFDVTPARLVTKLITERGVCEASEAGLSALYDETRED